MFSFIVYDKTQDKVYLARDRMGEKPIYWNIYGKGKLKKFTFASEIDAIYKLPFFKHSIN